MKNVYLILEETGNKRILFGLKVLEKSLVGAGYSVIPMEEKKLPDDIRSLEGEKIYVGSRNHNPWLKRMEEQDLLLYHTVEPENEGFYLSSLCGRLTVVSGGSFTGALYGALELAERIDRHKGIPRDLAFGDSPVFKLRGPAIGLQKTKVEPPRLTYEYPITPSRFPWFYDKDHWQELLDLMVKERCNVLYIWSGHPFSSLVKVPGYPEALEVTEEELTENRRVFLWLTEECDRRGIWVVLKFYNIHIPYPFAQAHGLDLLQSSIHPVVSDYTRKTLAQFVKDYPNIGVMVCLGEALRGNQNKTDWFIHTIIPGIKDGMALAGLKEEPPIILRGHDCDPKAVMTEAVKLYKNIHTMWKYNGESLTTFLPRGRWQEIHRGLSGLCENHILNIHILANLEPFRYGAPSFIQKCVQAAKYRLGGNGLHLYPLFYWDWPYSPDKTEPRLKQLDRDWIWYRAWFRYAWKPDRDPVQERFYWIGVLAKHFDCDQSTGEQILDALESAGEIAPRILQRVGITEGNRQTMSLGMTMSQFTNVKRYRPNLELWNSVASRGEQLDDYVLKELKGEPHLGETPLDLVQSVEYYALNAFNKIRQARGKAFKNQTELEKFATDVEAIYTLAFSYTAKIQAAIKILSYKHTMDESLKGPLNLLEEAVPLMEASLDWYRKLSHLTESTYLYANSMQTPQRKIPFPDGNAYVHWSRCLPEYEREAACFRRHLEEMKSGLYPREDREAPTDAAPLVPAEFGLLSENGRKYTVSKGESVFTDCSYLIENCALELKGLVGVRFGLGEAIEAGVKVRLEFLEDSLLLVGYMNARGVEWLQVPELETNTHADDRGGLSVVFKNAVKASSCPPVNIHAFRYEKGVHDIYMGTGGFMIAGVIPAGAPLKGRDADLAGESLASLDWLYE